MKKIIKLVVAVLLVILAVRFCTSQFGSVIQLPGGLGGESTGSSGSDGGWFSPREKTGGTTTGDVVEDMSIKDLERELGIGTEGNRTTTTTTTTTPSSTSSSTPLTFKGISMNGTLSNFGSELVKAGFRNNGNGTYTGSFAGYDGCKVTPSGSNPVREVRVDFPVISDWDALDKAYESLKASLTEKYGVTPTTSTSNNIATYDLPNGTITLDADVKDKSTWHVILTYANPSSLTVNPSGRNPIDDL